MNKLQFHEMLIKSLKRTLPFYDPRAIEKKSLSDQAAAYLAEFSCKWPESINRILFQNALSKQSNLSEKINRYIESSENKTSYKNSDVTFFIRTYRGDFCWLPNLFESIQNYAPDVTVVLCTDSADHADLVELTKGKYKTVSETAFCHGSIQQKYSKLTADKHCNTEFIIYLDSDTALVRPFKIKNWLCNNKPILEYTSYEEINRWFKENNSKAGNPEIWRKGVAKALCAPVDYEFSRRIEKIYKKSWIKEMREHLERVQNMPFEKFISLQKGLQTENDVDDIYFSDFNYMGAFLWQYKRDYVYWIDTTFLDYWTRTLSIVQFHSYTMTVVKDGEKQVNDIPTRFMNEIKALVKNSKNNHHIEIIKLYQEFRSRHQY